MTNPRAPRQARVTDQDLRQLFSKVDHLTRQMERVIELLELTPPRTPKAITEEERFYPGVGVIGNAPRDELSAVQRRAVEAAEAAEAVQ